MTTRSGIARVIYVIGLVLASAVAVNGVTDDSAVEWVVGPAMGMAIWWIAAGIAVRIGVTPTDFFQWLRSLAEGARRVP